MKSDGKMRNSEGPAEGGTKDSPPGRHGIQGTPDERSQGSVWTRVHLWPASRRCRDRRFWPWPPKPPS